MNQPDFSKYTDGLVPCIIQHKATQQVLMLGYMNEEAFRKTLSETVVTFYSRSKQRLWTKGETSGNYLKWEKWYLDCDADALLWQVLPTGAVCHRGTSSCFDLAMPESAMFVYQLEQIIAEKASGVDTKSYTLSLLHKGIHKVAQKVGEEAVELVIEALRTDRELFVNEAADLLYHYLVLLKAKGVSLAEVEALLLSRHNR